LRNLCNSWGHSHRGS